MVSQCSFDSHGRIGLNGVINMKNRVRYYVFLPVYFFLLAAFLLVAIGGSKVVSVLSLNAPILREKTVIIDAGHGGVDGGATSCTGVLESRFNLEIALRLEDLCHLLGLKTEMIRRTDCSVYTRGETIAQKKVSDLKERVRIVNEASNGVLISIHQNHFADSKYAGAQVFYAPTDGSQQLAMKLQSALVSAVNEGSNRKIKKANGVYLMQNIRSTGVLIECGFLSNPQEEYLLRSPEYQKKLCAVIACTVSSHLFDT